MKLGCSYGRLGKTYRFLKMLTEFLEFFLYVEEMILETFNWDNFSE